MKQNVDVLAYASEEICDNREPSLDVAKLHIGALGQLRGDRDFVKQAVEQNVGAAWEYASNEFRDSEGVH